MEWFLSASGEEVGLLKHFLAALGIDDTNPGQRVATFHGMLSGAGHAGRFAQVKVEGHCGRKPWLATKDTYRALYPYL